MGRATGRVVLDVTTDVSDWSSFAVTVGTASGALTGLLFVAVSVNAERISRRPALRATAAKTLVLFASALFVAVVLVVPGQVRWVLAVELIVLGLIVGTAMALVGRSAPADADVDVARLTRALDRTSPNLVTSVLITVACVTFLVRFGGGLYWLVPAVLLAFLGGGANTWLFLTRLVPPSA